MKSSFNIENSSLISGVVAGLLSYSINHSVWWCILHFICSWFYILYWLCSYSNVPELIIKYLVN